MVKSIDVGQTGSILRQGRAAETQPLLPGGDQPQAAAASSSDAYVRQDSAPLRPGLHRRRPHQADEVATQLPELPAPGPAADAPRTMTFAQRVAFARKAVRDGHPRAQWVWRPIVALCEQGSARWREVFDTYDETGFTALQEMLRKNAFACLNVVVYNLPKGSWADGDLLRKGSGLYTIRDGKIEGAGFEYGKHHWEQFYSGMFKDGLYEGFGVAYDGGWWYKGEWIEGKKYGWGISSWKNYAFVEEGIFINNKFGIDPRMGRPR